MDELQTQPRKMPQIVGGPAGEFPANIFYPSRIPKKNPSANNHKKQKTSGRRTDGGERFTP